MEISFDLLPKAIISLAEDGDSSHVVRQLRAFASLSSPILIVGPVGIGKEILARTIHEWSGRPGELIVQNCATVQEDEILLCLDTASTLVLKNVGNKVGFTLLETGRNERGADSSRQSASDLYLA